MKSLSKPALTAALVIAGLCGIVVVSWNSAMTRNTFDISDSADPSHRHLQYRSYCGCSECNTDVHNMQAPAGAGSDFTCGKRMKFLQHVMSNIAACRLVAREFPDICGVCNPDNCGVTMPPAVAPTLAPLPELLYVGDSTDRSTATPLGLCQGDCDRNDDCQSGLACYHRKAGDTVPGCDGLDEASDTDYCIDPYQFRSIPPQNMDDHANYTGDVFKLKISWQEGYRWQNEKFERNWCLRCSNEDDLGCTAGRPVSVTNCNVGSMVTQWSFSYLPNGTFQVKDSNSDLCLTFPDDELMPVYLDYCNPDDFHQQYFAQNGEASWGSNFEITPASIYDACVGTLHNPKYSEFLYVWKCELSRQWTTNAWNFY